MTTGRQSRRVASRSDVGTILISPWIVGSPQRQRAASDSLIGEWEQPPWPAGFLALTCLLSLDGTTVLNYAQWRSDPDHLAFMRTRRPAMVRSIDEDVPGIERPGVVRYRLHRAIGAGATTAGVDHRAAGSIEITTMRTEDVEAQARLLDAWTDAAARPVPGRTALYLHRSVDGTRALAYSQWVDDAAREAFHAGPLPDPLSPEEIEGTSGWEKAAYRRYRDVVPAEVPG
ncbi:MULTISPECIES: antibiotic biosynthesis monooxygenase [Actinoalloteichus]|uniref:Antibiotic biosynthesis monooxygenase n=1 Tax=Actinoalloteichus fjordicus TaxID=1612552 RepID=A0AAC9LFD3_9PSEU|nr:MULTISPECIES: antibiotic biosynthesis monooxygenase [Actinoalloteichus]APU16666.1 Antibiotic biosynthesis monooxygenase [Actinoalloteichus fjordicus]APU22732.1 Antibiotic biosynthesis monooxygenase [Actinoalloteichus sp. GBA129-24]